MRGFLATPLVCLAFGLALVPAAALAVDATAVMADACAGCHGTDGQSIGGMPAFSGKKGDELSSLLHDYKSGRRPATVMNRHAKGFSDEEIATLAAYISANWR